MASVIKKTGSGSIDDNFSQSVKDYGKLYPVIFISCASRDEAHFMKKKFKKSYLFETIMSDHNFENKSVQHLLMVVNEKLENTYFSDKHIRYEREIGEALSMKEFIDICENIFKKQLISMKIFKITEHIGFRIDSGEVEFFKSKNYCSLADCRVFTHKIS